MQTAARDPLAGIRKKRKLSADQSLCLLQHSGTLHGPSACHFHRLRTAGACGTCCRTVATREQLPYCILVVDALPYPRLMLAVHKLSPSPDLQRCCCVSRRLQCIINSSHVQTLANVVAPGRLHGSCTTPPWVAAHDMVDGALQNALCTLQCVMVSLAVCRAQPVHSPQACTCFVCPSVNLAGVSELFHQVLPFAAYVKHSLVAAVPNVG